MEGTWGRRVFGTVSRTPRNTRFRLEVRLDNGCVIFQVIHVPNNELEAFPGLYGFTLDQITAKLDERIKERHQEWLRA